MLLKASAGVSETCNIFVHEKKKSTDDIRTADIYINIQEVTTLILYLH